MPGMNGRSRMRASALRERIQIQGVCADLNILIRPIYTPAINSDDCSAEYLRIKQWLEAWIPFQVLAQIDNQLLTLSKGQRQTKICQRLYSR